ncbi:MAG: glycosyl transferase [Burkholderiales bacterium PBB4]|nr:MAG: glycosyl transferase [Burkholderiales bacterium PBB4]
MFLFIHQNFPAQFKNIAPQLARLGHEVVALTPRDLGTENWGGVRIVNYAIHQASGTNLHRWLSDLETKTIRAEACFLAALKLRKEGFSPDRIIAHPGWGESLFLKEVWPKARLGIYCEFYYNLDGFDVGFDPEHSDVREDEGARLRMRNANNLMHFDIADAGLSPTEWQKSTFPMSFKDKISVVHEGIDTAVLRPNDQVKLKIGDKVVVQKGDPIITFVNRNLEPYRGYHIFMRALPSVLKAHPTARVLIVGGDEVSYGSAPPGGRSWKDIYLDEARQDLSAEELGRIHFLGKIGYEQFVSVMQISMVHVYLTYPFVLSWSLLEAMSIGCSIIGSDTAPVAEVIENGVQGVLVDFFDKDKLTSEILDLINDRQKRGIFGRNASEKILKRYDLQKICLPSSVEWCINL